MKIVAHGAKRREGSRRLVTRKNLQIWNGYHALGSWGCGIRFRHCFPGSMKIKVQGRRRRREGNWGRKKSNVSDRYCFLGFRDRGISFWHWFSERSPFRTSSPLPKNVEAVTEKVKTISCVVFHGKQHFKRYGIWQYYGRQNIIWTRNTYHEYLRQITYVISSPWPCARLPVSLSAGTVA